MKPGLIGPFGSLLEIKALPSPLPASSERPSSEKVLLSGARRVQRASRSARKWTLRFVSGDAVDLSNLIALEQGAFGPPPWFWYDPMAARLNMLPDVVATAGVGPAPWRWLAADESGLTVAGPLTLHDGRVLTFSVQPAGTLVVPRRDGVEDPVPVIEGRTYTASAHVDGEGTAALRWVDDAGATLSTDSSASGSGRRVVSVEAPSGAAGALVEVDGPRVGGLQLTEGLLVDWQPGMGIPRVVFSGAEVAYRLVTAQETRRDVTVELVETS